MLAKLREEVNRLKPRRIRHKHRHERGRELDTLNNIERTLEYTEVLRNARA